VSEKKVIFADLTADRRPAVPVCEARKPRRAQQTCFRRRDGTVRWRKIARSL